MVDRPYLNGVAGMSDEMDGAGNDSPSENGMGGRLPPPVFPPGNRKRQATRTRKETPEGVEGALISPDEPMPERSGIPDEPMERLARMADDDAWISPDEPMPERSVATIVEAEEVDPDEVVVTGIGHQAHLDPEEIAMGGDPHVMKVTEVVSKLAEALKQKGEAGLRASPEMGMFEATLRGYCVGYLAGRRAEEDLPELEESERGSW